MLEWLVHLSICLIDNDFIDGSRICIFFENCQDIQVASQILQNLTDLDKMLMERIQFCEINEVNLSKEDSLIIIYNPNNIESIHPETLEDVQAICFHGALRNIPIIMTNPSLIATAWNDYGARRPL